MEAIAATWEDGGWTVAAVRPWVDAAGDPDGLVVTGFRDGVAAWGFDGGAPWAVTDGPLVVTFEGALPVPIAFVEMTGRPPAEALVWEHSPEGVRFPAAVRLERAAGGATAERLWESLDPVESLAIVDLEGDGALDGAALSRFDRCPDPVGTEGVGAGGAGERCRLLRVWSNGNGVPMTYRVETSRGWTALGRDDLDRVAALLADPPCPALDLRDWRVSRRPGLTDANREAELVEGVRCAPGPEDRVPAMRAYLAVTVPTSDREVPDVRWLSRSGGDSAGAADGYELLADLDGDGMREWRWERPRETGTAWEVTRGAPAGALLGRWFIDDESGLVSRRVVPPPGGRVTVEEAEWLPGAEPAVRLRLRVEPAGGGEGRVEEITLPLTDR
jgi:hypothetical protein